VILEGMDAPQGLFTILTETPKVGDDVEKKKRFHAQENMDEVR